MTETGKAAAAWLITTTQTNLFHIFSTPAEQRTPEQKKQIKGLEALDNAFQTHKDNLQKAKKHLDKAAPFFAAIMQETGYPGDQCPSAMQVAALADKGV